MVFTTDICTQQYFFLRKNYQHRRIFLLFLCYFMKKGGKERAERVLCATLQNLKVILASSPRFAGLSLEVFMNIVLSQCIVDFKLILYFKKEYRALTLNDLLKEHSVLYNLTVTPDLQNKSKRKTSPGLVVDLEPLQLNPVVVSGKYKRLRSFLLLLKGATTHVGMPSYAQLTTEMVLTFLKKSVSYKLKMEMVQLICLYKANIQFKKRG